LRCGRREDQARGEQRSSHALPDHAASPLAAGTATSPKNAPTGTPSSSESRMSSDEEKSTLPERRRETCGCDRPRAAATSLCDTPHRAISALTFATTEAGYALDALTMRHTLCTSCIEVNPTA